MSDNNNIELKEFFAEKTGDKIHIELEVKGDPDKVISSLMEAMSKNTNVFDGAVVTQMYFKENSLKNHIEDQNKKVLFLLKEAINMIERI